MRSTVFHLLAVFASTSAFSTSPIPSTSTARSDRPVSPLHVSNLFDIFSPAKSSQKNVELASELKQEIRSLAARTQNGIVAADEVRSAIAENVRRLEAINPTSDLTSSAKLNGSWKLVYTTNGGSSAGKLGPFVGDVEQLIRLGNDNSDTDGDDYINYVRLGGGAVEGALTATWDVKSKKEWQVNFQSIRFSILGIPVVEKELGATGIWRKSYLDDDFRILYAIGGKNAINENIYILSK